MLNGAKIRTISGTTKFFLDYFGIVWPADEAGPIERNKCIKYIYRKNSLKSDIVLFTLICTFLLKMYYFHAKTRTFAKKYQYLSRKICNNLNFCVIFANDY